MIYINGVSVFEIEEDSSIPKGIEEPDSVTEEGSASETPLC